MTTPVSSYSQSQALSDPIVPPSNAPATPPGGAGSQAAAGASASEAVTLTPDAQTSAELLEAARAAAGIDEPAVQSLKANILSDTYQVPPENLAASIIAAMAETSS
jgi:anti-sigma28 factor (negative regulator of flagellin synthesis)